MADMTFGELHKELREKLRLTLRKYYVITGIDPGYINRMERGKAPPPTDRIFWRMIGALGIEMGSRECLQLDFLREAHWSAPPPMTNEELLKKLPMPPHKSDGTLFTEAELDKLIEIIRES